MTEPKRLAKRAAVRDIEHRLDIGPNIVRADDDLVDVARRAIAQPHTRLLSVVDDEERLVGVLPVLRVVEEVVARAHPEALMADVTDLESAARFGREVGALIAGDLMSPPVALQETSTVADAFRAMHDHHYSGLPLISSDGRVVGYIDLLELALRYLEDYPLPGSGDEAAAGRPHEAHHSTDGATD